MKKPLDDIKALCKFLFNVQLYPYQIKIMDALFKKKKRKITIRSATRAGKSFSIAIAAILFATFNDNVRVGIVAPSYDKTRPIMDYIAEVLNNTPYFENFLMLDTEGMSKIERLRKEVSKKRITFRNGSIIEIKSVDMQKRGMAFMGFGYELCIIEECGEIPDDVYAKIYRTLVEDHDSIILEIGNPWSLGAFYRHHHDDDWEKIHIHWKDCVSAGRMTEEAIIDQRNEITEMEFKILFEAEFPNELEFAVFKNQWVEDACRQTEAIPTKYGIGVDVARGGRDLSVITVIGLIEKTNEFMLVESKTINTGNTMEVVGEVQRTVSKYPKSVISVDTVGVGGGVHDRLKEEHYNVKPFIAGSKSFSKRFYNKKSETIYGLAKVFEEKRFFNLPPNSKYTMQLRQWEHEAQSDRTMRVKDPESKSPDEADSLVIAFDSLNLRDDMVFLKPSSLF